MEFTFDKFITYPDSPSIFLQKNVSEADDLFRVPFLSTPDMDEPSIFASDSYPTHSSSPPTSESYSSSRLPFKIIRPKGKQEMKQVSLTSKQIKKREKAREKTERKNREVAMILSKAAKKYIPPALEDPNLDEKTKRHLIQVVKNRMAAQQTRDRRKAEQDEVSEVKKRLEEDNRRLNDQNQFLIERLKALEEAQMRILAENEELKRNQAMQAAQIAQMSQMSQMPQMQQMPHMSQMPPHMHQRPQMQMSQMPPHVPSEINIDVYEDEKPLATFEVENSMTPMLSRSNRKKNPFGYLFTFTTLLMIMNGLNTTQLQPVPKGPPGGPIPGNGPSSNSPGGHHGGDPHDGGHHWDGHGEGGGGGTNTHGFGPDTGNPTLGPDTTNPNFDPNSIPNFTPGDSTPSDGPDISISSTGTGESTGSTSGGDTTGQDSNPGGDTIGQDSNPGGDTSSQDSNNKGNGNGESGGSSSGAQEDVHTMSVASGTESGESNEESFGTKMGEYKNSTDNSTILDTARETGRDFGNGGADLTGSPQEEQSTEEGSSGRSNRMLELSDPIFVSDPTEETVNLLTKSSPETLDDLERGFFRAGPKKKAKQEP